MAKKERGFEARAAARESRAQNKIAASRAAKATGERGFASELQRGRIKQRDLDMAVRDVGGRGSAEVGRARAAAQSFRSGGAKAAGRGIRELVSDVGRSTASRLVKGAMRGMLSPAGLAEEFAGRAAQSAAKKRFMKEAGEQGKRGKGGMRKPHTKA